MATTTTKEQLSERIMDAIATFGPERDQVKPEATWQELDVDSLDLVELAQIAEDEYGLEIKGEDFEELRTVGEAIDLIWSRRQQ